MDMMVGRGTHRQLTIGDVGGQDNWSSMKLLNKQGMPLYLLYSFVFLLITPHAFLTRLKEPIFPLRAKGVQFDYSDIVSYNIRCEDSGEKAMPWAS